MHQPTAYWVAGRLLTHLQQWAQAAGCTGSPVDQPHATPHDRVPVDVQFALWSVCAEQQAPGFALHAGASMAVHTLPTIGPLLSVSSTTRAVLQVFVAGGPLISNAAVTTFHEGPMDGGIYMRTLLDHHPIEAVESALGNWTRVIQSLSGRAVSPKAVHIPYRDEGRPHARFFGCPIVYETERAALVFTTEDLDTPLLGHDPDAELLLRSLLDDRTRDAGHTLATQCRLALLGMRATNDTRLNEVAEFMGTSTRSLQRGLQAEGLHYRAMLDAVLSERAFRLLRDPDLTLDAIALMLGYQRRSFNRAFSRWTGAPPATYRKANSSS